MLATLLPLLATQLDGLTTEVTTEIGAEIETELLVIDNDPDQSARAVLQAFADRRGTSAAARIGYRAEPTPGVVAVRNRALAETEDRELLVFLDDDQQPSDGWLAALVGRWIAAPPDRRPAAVAGPVISVLPGADEFEDAWIREGGFFDRSYRDALRTGDVIAEVATTNLLLDRAQVSRRGLRFDPGFGLSGGEDSLFTRRLTGSGGQIQWCREASVLERVPAARLRRGWVCRRAVSSGNTAARIELTLAASDRQRTRVRGRLLSRAVVRTLGGAVRYLLASARRSPGGQGRAARTVCRGVGMLLGALELSYLEYGRNGRRWARAAR